MPQYAVVRNLDETLYDKVKSSDYGKTSGEIETIVGSAYATLRGFGDNISLSYPACEFLLFCNETTSDEVCIPTRGSDWYDNGRYQQAELHTWGNDNLLILSSWRYCYEGISKVNAVIYQVKKSELSEKEKKCSICRIRNQGILLFNSSRYDWYCALITISKTQAYQKSTPPNYMLSLNQNCSTS